MLHVAWHSMKWHDCIALCTSTSHDRGVSAWFGLTLCLVFDNLLWAQGRLTPCLALMVGSVTWTTSKMSRMVLR